MAKARSELRTRYAKRHAGSEAKQQEALARAQANADEATQDKLDSQMDALSQKMDGGS
jgi:hypothetical protein